jgi:hypothetical protein
VAQDKDPVAGSCEHGNDGRVKILIVSAACLIERSVTDVFRTGISLNMV